MPGGGELEPGGEEEMEIYSPEAEKNRRAAMASGG